MPLHSGSTKPISKPSFPRMKFILLAVSLVATCIAIFSVTASKLLVKSLDFTAPNAAPKNADIFFGAEVVSIDPITRTFVMDWFPAHQCGCNPNETLDSDIYLDPSLLDTSSPSFSLQHPYVPAYRFNTTTLCSALGESNPTIRTVSKLPTLHQNPGPLIGRSSLQDYPFDVYFAKFVLYALDHTTGEFITCNVTQSGGIAVNFQVTLQRAFLPQTYPTLFITLQIERSLATKILVIIIAVTNWLVAAAFIVVCAATLVYPPHEIYSKIFVVPVGALFAFTNVRANLPGAPLGFGATIDLYSILPVLVILALSSFFLLLIVLSRRLYSPHPVCDHEMTSSFTNTLRQDSTSTYVCPANEDGDEKGSIREVSSQKGTCD